jgi:hypothetical protein
VITEVYTALNVNGSHPGIRRRAGSYIGTYVSKEISASVFRVLQSAQQWALS